jgi:hypothetical protein
LVLTGYTLVKSVLGRPNGNFRDESRHGGYERICLREDLDVLTRNKPKSAAKLPASISEPDVKQPKVFGITALLRFLIPLPFGRCATGCAELSFFLFFLWVKTLSFSAGRS